jgi:hypothetical protein
MRDLKKLRNQPYYRSEVRLYSQVLAHGNNHNRRRLAIAFFAREIICLGLFKRVFVPKANWRSRSLVRDRGDGTLVAILHLIVNFETHFGLDVFIGYI